MTDFDYRIGELPEFGKYTRMHKRMMDLIGDHSLEVGTAWTVRNSPYMDLHLEIIEKSDRFVVVAMSHTYEQNFDLMRDPEMTIKLYTVKEWPMCEALTYQQDGLGIFQQVYPEPGKVYPKLKKELNRFLITWLKNLRSQGFYK